MDKFLQLIRLHLKQRSDSQPQQSLIHPGSRRLDLRARYHEKSSGAGSARILVAEDNLVNQRVIHKLLSNMGHQVILVNDGEAALNKLGSERFDLAILDMHMPHMSGLEAVKRWRFMESGHMPIIMLTADARIGIEAESLEAGFDAILVKPVKRVEISELIAYLISQSQQPTVPHSENNQAEVHTDGALDESVLTGIAQLGGNALIREIMDFFREDSVRCLEKARRALFTRDQALWRDQFHILKGGARDIGARKLAHLCASAEKLILIHDDRSEATRKLGEIQNALTESQSEIQAYIQRNF